MRRLICKMLGHKWILTKHPRGGVMYGYCDRCGVKWADYIHRVMEKYQ